MIRARRASIVLSLVLAACGGAEPSGSSSTSAAPSAAAPASSGGETSAAVSAATLTLTGEGLPRSLGGPLSPDYADMTRWDPEQGRLVAYFGTGDSAFGLNLNLGSPFAVGETEVRTGPVSFETGEGFEQRIDVREARVVIESVDREARTLRLRVEGHTTSDSGGQPEAFALEASVAVPAAAQ